jgi:hypothetical protein
MKKLSTFVLLLFCAAIAVQAQSFAFFKDGEELPDNASYTASEVETFPILVVESGLELTNKTSGIVPVRISQTVLQAPVTDGAWLSLCFDQCYATNENQIVTGQLLAGFASLFHVYFNPVAGQNETVVVKYDVINVDNPFEKKTVTITYLYGTTDVENPTKTANIAFFGKSVKYDFASVADRRLQIFDLTGKCVSNIKLERISDTINLSELAKGLYLYRLLENSNILKNSKFTIN